MVWPKCCIFCLSKGFAQIRIKWDTEHQCVHICGVATCMYEGDQGIFEETEISSLILFPLRLVIDKINSIYYPSLLQFARFKTVCGNCQWETFLPVTTSLDSRARIFLPRSSLNLLISFIRPRNIPHKQSSKHYRFQILIPQCFAGVLINDYDDYLDFTGAVVKENKSFTLWRILRFYGHNVWL